VSRLDPDILGQRDESFIRRLFPLVDGVMRRYHRADVRGIDRIPEGAALFVGNHSGALLSIDSFLFAAEVIRERGVDDLPWGLAHDMAVDLPGLRDILVPLGAVRATHENANALFEAGQKVLVYPGGDLDAMRPYRDRNEVRFGGRKGFARLAIRHGVPIVPLITAGAHGTLVIFDDLRPLVRFIGLDRTRFRLGVWPVSFSLPWGFSFGPSPPYVPLPTQITIEVLDPIHFERSGEDAANDADYVAACADEAWRTMQGAVDRLALERDANRRRR